MSRGLLNLEAFAGARIRIMPDCHAGAGCVIGFTADLGGSRQLGKQTVEYYQTMAVGLHTGKEAMWEEEERIKAAYKAAGRRGKIHEALKDLHRNFRQTPPDVPREYCFLYGKYSEQYLHDMKICQEFADENRKMIAKLILEHYGMEPLGSFTTAHNYIDCDSNVIRKGAVSAKKGERILIPLNMRDGSLICVGKGNPDWNESAPHGAGRHCSRSEAKRLFSVEEYDGAMREAGVYSTSVNHSTLDECPMAYKDKEDILPYIKRVVAEESILRFALVYHRKDSVSDKKERLPFFLYSVII